MLDPILVTPPATEPITLAEAKLHLRVDHSEEDTVINGLIAAARIYVEQRCWISLVAQTWKVYLCDWPDSSVMLPRGPVTGITTVKYQTSNGVWVTLASTEYTLQGDIVRLAYNAQWPSTELFGHMPVEIIYTAGAGADQAIKQAMLLLIGHWYENRESAVVTPGATAVKVPFAVDSLLYLYEMR